METRAPHFRALVLPTVFGLTCVILTLLLYLRFGGSGPFEPQGYRIGVPLPDAANLTGGSDVQIAGVDVGRVEDVEREGDRALATIELKPAYVPLRVGTRAIVRTKTLVGEAYLELAPGAAGAPAIPEGGRLAPERVQPTVQLDEFLQTFAPGTRDDLRALFGGLATALEGRGDDLNRSLARLAPVSADLAHVLETLERRGDELGQLFAGAGDTLAALAEREGALQAAIDAGHAVLATTGRRDRELAATVRELAPFLQQLEATSVTIRDASGDLNAAVAALQPVAPLVPPALREIEAVAPDLQALFAGLPPLLTAGNRGLPALEPLSRATRTGFRAFYPASRELLPTLQLLAVNRLSPIFFFANVAQVMNGTFVGPGGLVRNYGVGIITLWNETVAGWKHKLPTNRQNPYPKPPDGLLDTGRLGYLKAYDCRHVDNPLLLPPIGNGAPPCVEQGPWEFNGKSAYYPRLTLAPP